MPVQMRHHIAQAGEVDFVGRQRFAQQLLGQRHRVQAGQALQRGQVAELGHMRVPHHPVKRRKQGVVCPDQAEFRTAPDQPPAVGLTECAVRLARHRSRALRRAHHDHRPGRQACGRTTGRLHADGKRLGLRQMRLRRLGNGVAALPRRHDAQGNGGALCGQQPELVALAAGWRHGANGRQSQLAVLHRHNGGLPARAVHQCRHLYRRGRTTADLRVLHQHHD